MPHLIDKSAVVAEIDEIVRVLQKNCNPNPMGNMQECLAAAQIEAINLIKDFLDTLELKEVDLDRDIRAYLTNHFNIYEDGVLQSKKSGLPLSTYDIIKVAEHFFELGLKAQKGE